MSLQISQLRIVGMPCSFSLGYALLFTDLFGYTLLPDKLLHPVESVLVGEASQALVLPRHLVALHHVLKYQVGDST